MPTELNLQDPKDDPQDPPEAPSEMSQVLAALVALQPASEEPAPPESPPPPPTPAGSRVTKAEYEALQVYAAEQRQIAERMTLAQEFGIEAKDLEGDFESPADMRRHAEVLALRQHLTDLEALLTEVRTETQGPPEVPNTDTGGPTSIEATEVQALKEKYEKARAGGRTDESRRALLAAIYLDPTKRSQVFVR